MLQTLEAPELVFGLCSPLGTENARVAKLIADELLVYRYSCGVFKVTNLMKSIVIPNINLVESPVEKRFDSYIRYANKIRELTETPGILAMMCCAAIRSTRRTKTKAAGHFSPNNAYIFDQFKRKEEIEVLRQVYGRLFVCVSIYSDKSRRAAKLAQDISISHAEASARQFHDELANQLIARDENEENEPHGQRLRDAFPLADIFVNIDDLPGAKMVVERFLQALFGSNKISPSRDEYGMYIAKSASLRSLDLSRQVGAAIFSNHGEVITLGCNEVPKAGGGTYWCGDNLDARDYTLGRDENERVKRALLADVVKRLMESGLIKHADDDTEEGILNYIISESGKKDSILREAMLMDLLEFGRTMHAEMSALMDASRVGRSVSGATLYSTTYPCHLCAKHIIAAGIKKVVFVEPYPKSFAEQLYQEIVVGADKDGERRVQFSPFIGISPVRFRDLFERGRRKDSRGVFSEWAEGKPRLIVKYTVAVWLANERAITAILTKKLNSLMRDGKIEVKPARTQ